MTRPISLILIVAVLSGCPKQPERNLLAEAEQLYLDMRYDEAIALLKQHLVRHPEDAGAHFYLGTCYLSSSQNAWLGIAQGELQTALALFQRQGKVNPIPRFNSATYFEMICHINLAKVYLRLIINVMDTDPSRLQVDKRAAIRKLVDGLEEQYEAARAIAPNDADVMSLRQRIIDIRAMVRFAPQSDATRAQNGIRRTAHTHPLDARLVTTT